MRPARGKQMFWYIDPAHTSVSFSVKHMMLSTVRGSLGKASGRIDLDPAHPEQGDFEIAVQVNGITTGDMKRDGHLASPDFFHVEKYPEITFKSKAIFPKADGRYTVSGDLTIREITRPVSFDVELLGTAVNGQGGSAPRCRRERDHRPDRLRSHVEHADTERRPGGRQAEGRGRSRGY